MLPFSWKRKCNNGRCHLRYEVLRKDYDFDESSQVISVVVGKEKRVFLVEPFVLEEKPFRILMDMTESIYRREERYIFVNNVDSILFEHMLWLFRNDFSSSCSFCWKDIIDFYAEPAS